MEGDSKLELLKLELQDAKELEEFVKSISLDLSLKIREILEYWKKKNLFDLLAI